MRIFAGSEKKNVIYRSNGKRACNRSSSSYSIGFRGFFLIKYFIFFIIEIKTKRHRKTRTLLISEMGLLLRFEVVLQTNLPYKCIEDEK